MQWINSMNYDDLKLMNEGEFISPKHQQHASQLTKLMKQKPYETCKTQQTL